ncbi:YdeI/OmpD-associated family protein [Arthrobacter agilis]|uniref:YdeI/OmpD-associated family protein n=1 Tax=Arthrobacter agilis TaxID=37921 RepID=UPI0023665BA1|nr:YdeI/OmpD-associated family protein [Arthrobacter agilis]WDF33696.1 YdeI/OmpD-associated family protein [Arthrobacter agilis]
MKAELPELLLPDPQAWRLWLEEHHDESPGVWLIQHKKGGSTTLLTYAQALDEALCVGWIDGQARSRDDGSYFQRFTPRGPRSIWSIRNRTYVDRLRSEGRMRDAGERAVAAAQADGRWERAYAGPADATVPVELMAAIEANDAALAMFGTLSSQNRYAMIFRLSQLKTDVAKERNIAKFVAMLARGETFYPQGPKAGGR